MRHAIVILAPEETPEGRGRILHALHTARALAAHDETVQVFFGGIGVTCLPAFLSRDNPFTRNYGDLFDQILPLVAGACDFCSQSRFDSATAAADLGVELVGGQGQHHDLAELLAAGWQVVTF